MIDYICAALLASAIVAVSVDNVRKGKEISRLIDILTGTKAGKVLGTKVISPYKSKDDGGGDD